MNKKFLYVLFMAFISVFMLVGCGGNKDEVTIKINNSAEMNVGDKVAIDVTVENASKDEVSYASSDETVIKIENNELNALKAGSATITASVGKVKAELAITVKDGAAKYSLELELNGGAIAGGLPNPQLLVITEEFTLPVPTKEGASFDGWYLNSDFSGEKITVLKNVTTSSVKLYAKWVEANYKVVYNFTDSKGATSKEEVTVSCKEAYNVVAKSVGSGELFTGWFEEAELVNEVKNFAANSVEANEVINLYGKAISSSATFNVSFEYNGGSTLYATREDMVADFLKDYNFVNKKSFQTIKQIGTNASGPLDFGEFYRSGVTEDGDKVNEKWAWLYKYVYDKSVEKLSSNSNVVSGLKALVVNKKNSYSTDEEKGISVGIRSFVMGLRIGTGQLQSVDFTKYNEQNGFWEYLSANEAASLTISASGSNLPKPDKEFYEFVGWFRDAEGTQGPVKNVFANGKLYAKYEENTPVDEIKINKKAPNTLKFKTIQLEWTITPSDATVRNVKFSSSNPEVATITQDGLITAVASGKTKIRITTNSQSGEYDEYELEVYVPDFIDASYDTVSYVNVGETIKLNAVPAGREAQTQKIVWTSSDETIATVANGVVTGVKDGFVNIRATVEGSSTNYFDFGVTVLDTNASAIKKFIASQNVGNVFFRYDLGIGAGTPEYYMDIIGSISKLLYNTPYTIDRSYEATQKNISSNHGGEKSSTEFITVHYTGNMTKGATAKANASYFAGGGGGTSIHYVTGNDGIYHVLDDKLVGFHAGDSTNVEFKWYPTGVKVKADDPQYPVWGISKNSKYMINGQETTVDVPEGPNSGNKKVTGDTFIYNGVEQPCINKIGLPFKIVGDEYYMGTTWWCTTQISAGRLCSKGGNLNSIGIESAVNEGTDLWYTWQVTAQLVAHLMVENNLDITRVVGHHFFSAKDCPQPMLENDLEIWYEFKKLVEAEYELLTKYSNYEISMTVNNATNVNDKGRVTKQSGNLCQSVNYTVTIKDKSSGATETVTLGGIIQSMYER